jgi:hypothetical protein
MQLDREYVSLVIYKQRQQELIREAEQDRLVKQIFDSLRRGKKNEDNTADDNRR